MYFYTPALFSLKSGVIINLKLVLYQSSVGVALFPITPQHQAQRIMEKIKYIFLFTAILIVTALMIFRYHFLVIPEGYDSKGRLSSLPSNQESPPSADAVTSSGDISDASAVFPVQVKTVGANTKTHDNGEMTEDEGTEKKAEEDSKDDKEDPLRPAHQKSQPPQSEKNKHTVARELIDQAAALIRRGHYERAEPLLRESLKIDRKNPAAWRQLANLYRRSDQPDMEMSLYEEWLRAMPGNTESLLGLAEIHIRHEDYGRARDYLAQSEVRPDEVGQYGKIASLYRRLDDPLEEGRVLSDWMNSAPASQDARKEWAHYQRRQGNFEVALNEYGRLLEELPADSALQRRMGDTYGNLGDYQTAAYYYQNALALQPQNPGLLSRLAEAEFRAHNYQGAVDAWSAIIANHPDTAMAESARRRIDEISESMPEQ